MRGRTPSAGRSETGLRAAIRRPRRLLEPGIGQRAKSRGFGGSAPI